MLYGLQKPEETGGLFSEAAIFGVVFKPGVDESLDGRDMEFHLVK